MEITRVNVNNNRTMMVNPSGFTSAVTISRAWNLSSLTEDFVLVNKETNEEIPFFIIPISEGSIKVGLADDPGTPYTISEAEVAANQGTPMLYLVKRIFKTGTTTPLLNVGI